MKYKEKRIKKSQFPVTRMNANKNPDGDGNFNNAPYLNFNDGELKLNCNHVENTNPNYGSGSLQQC